LVINPVFAPATWLTVKIVPEFTYNVSNGMLNPAAGKDPSMVQGTAAPCDIFVKECQICA